MATNKVVSFAACTAAVLTYKCAANYACACHTILCKKCNQYTFNSLNCDCVNAGGQRVSSPIIYQLFDEIDFSVNIDSNSLFVILKK
ncbi:MAG: hypothetical protein RIQ89_1028 [Bacteroidota bacterium]|jgi:hypothetical protein